MVLGQHYTIFKHAKSLTFIIPPSTSQKLELNVPNATDLEYTKSKKTTNMILTNKNCFSFLF